MALSGWCGTRGRPDCVRCRSSVCGCSCHDAESPQNKADERGSGGGLGENGGAASTANEAARMTAAKRSHPGLTPIPHYRNGG